MHLAAWIAIPSLHAPQQADGIAINSLPSYLTSTLLRSAHFLFPGEDSMEAMNKARKIMMRVGWGLSFILVSGGHVAGGLAGS